jgi:hypothetical protein
VAKNGETAAATPIDAPMRCPAWRSPPARPMPPDISGSSCWWCARRHGVAAQKLMFSQIASAAGPVLVPAAEAIWCERRVRPLS